MIHNYYYTICKYFEALQFNNDPFKNDSLILIKHKSPFQNCSYFQQICKNKIY